jgi:mycobactin salicyl-AMP ligase
MNDKSRSEERRLHGTWAHLTLDALVETAVRARPGRRSFIDALDIGTWSDLTPKSTNAGEFGALVTHFARQMLSLGLHQGDAVLVAMPNCVDGVASLLGLIAVGLVPCPVSVVANAREIQTAAEVTGAKAIITVNRYADFRPSDAAREAASRFYGVRFICAFGPDAPEGVVSLDDWKDSELSGNPMPMNMASAPAVITLDKSGDSVTAHVRTHAQVISDALALSAISGLTGRGAIIATFAPVSAAGFVSTVAAPLISGTMVTLHGPFEPAILRAQMMACPEAIVVLPATVEADIRKVLGISLKDTIVVTRDLETARPAISPGRVTELLSLGETALWSLLRDSNRARLRIPRFYTHPVGTALPRTVAQIEATLSPRGMLALSGFGIARRWRAEAGQTTAALETGWRAHGDGPDHFSATPDEREIDSESVTFAVVAA